MGLATLSDCQNRPYRHPSKTCACTGPFWRPRTPQDPPKTLPRPPQDGPRRIRQHPKLRNLNLGCHRPPKNPSRPPQDPPRRPKNCLQIIFINSFSISSQTLGKSFKKMVIEGQIFLMFVFLMLAQGVSHFCSRALDLEPEAKHLVCVFVCHCLSVCLYVCLRSYI